MWWLKSRVVKVLLYLKVIILLKVKKCWGWMWWSYFSLILIMVDLMKVCIFFVVVYWVMCVLLYVIMKVSLYNCWWVLCMKLVMCVMSKVYLSIWLVFWLVKCVWWVFMNYNFCFLRCKWVVVLCLLFILLNW